MKGVTNVKKEKFKILKFFIVLIMLITMVVITAL